ncbi:MAG: DUF1854 domain-containing protein [Pirellulales bacterium]|nr:DUF1854 domain-containing protein [Pirellulales bacterium]
MNNSHNITAVVRDAYGNLRVEFADGGGCGDVRPVRGFPISQPEYGVALVDADGREVCWIEDFTALPAAIRQPLAEELALRDFLPRITRVVSVSRLAEPCEWQVETDRGPTRFVLKSDEHVRRIDAQRAMVTDAFGVQYLVKNLKQMDAASRRYLERYL